MLTCVNQYEDLKLEENGTSQPMLDLLVYGLFRPMSDDGSEDVQLTRQLTLSLAFALRMLRRRGVIPMLANLAVFLVAFVFSLVLTFHDLGGGDGSFSFSLAFGLLMTWLPLLVVFSIVDRNPVSSARAEQLISRYLHNVSYVKATYDIGPVHERFTWWKPDTVIPDALTLGPFIGQGRRLRYCGLPHAFLAVTERLDFRRVRREDLEQHAGRTARELNDGKPTAWYAIWVVSFSLVWCAILSAFVVSFRSPTVGLGCRTLVYLLFGGFSSVSWLIQLSKNPPPAAVKLSYTFNGLSLLSLLVLVTFQVTGVTANTCWCKTSNAAAALGLGGYMDFGNLAFYKEHYDVVRWWTGAAVVGVLVPVMAFVVALFWWMRCSNLWKADETNRPEMPPVTPDGRVLAADTRWLM